jgi:hypothetical protein
MRSCRLTASRFQLTASFLLDRNTVLSLVQLQSVRTALESKASNDQMSELKRVLSEVDKLVRNRLTCPGGNKMAAILLAKRLTNLQGSRYRLTLTYPLAS